jgi:hypothetical protein
MGVFNVEKVNNSDSVKSFEREELINFLAEELFYSYESKKIIKNEFLRTCQLRSKAIGEELFFLTVDFYRQKGLSRWKHNMSDFITQAAKEQIESGSKNLSGLIFEHIVPKNIYIKKLSEAAANGQLSIALISDTLHKYYYTCTVTVAEDKLLGRTQMPAGWDLEDPFYRYKNAGIEYTENPHNFRVKDKK